MSKKENRRAALQDAKKAILLAEIEMEHQEHIDLLQDVMDTIERIDEELE